MKPNYTPLKKLNEKSKGYKLKVKVLQKSPPAESPSKHRYQKLVLKDDEGSTMKATLFGNDIETYEQALQRNRVYEISDVNVKQLPVQFRSRPDEEYQMNLGGRMKIRALDLSECFDEPLYRELLKIPSTYTADDPLLDLVAVVVFVSEEHEESFGGYTQQTRDIVLADQSLARPVKLSARNRCALPEAAVFITNWHDNFRVIGFTGIRSNTYRGLSVATTLSSAYHANPIGSAADTVRSWMENNIALLSDWRAKALLLYSDEPSKIQTPLACIIQRKANTIWQDEYYWATVCLTHLQAQDLYFYYSCGNYGKRTSGNPGTQFYCFNCGTKEATVETRSILTTDIVDSTGSLKVTAYSSETELLFNLKTDELSTLSKQNTKAIEETITKLRNKLFLVKICPNHELSTSNVLKWILTATEPAAIALQDEAGNDGKLKGIECSGEASGSTPPGSDACTDVHEKAPETEAYAKGAVVPFLEEEASLDGVGGPEPVIGPTQTEPAKAYSLIEDAYTKFDAAAAILTQTGTQTAGEASSSNVLAGESQDPDTDEALFTTPDN